MNIVDSTMTPPTVRWMVTLEGVGPVRFGRTVTQLGADLRDGLRGTR